ncbi:hypothetical protein [Nonomuraea salmonea]
MIGSALPPILLVCDTLVWMSAVSRPWASAPSATRCVLGVRPPTAR